MSDDVFKCEKCGAFATDKRACPACGTERPVWELDAWDMAVSERLELAPRDENATPVQTRPTVYGLTWEEYQRILQDDSPLGRYDVLIGVRWP